VSFLDLFRQGDAVTRLVAVLLLVMSVASWVVILWKGWVLHRGSFRACTTAAA
jgi:biopolymer transport protein ExbB